METPISPERALALADKFSYLNNRERSKEQNIIAADMLFPGHVQTGMIDMWKYFLEAKEAVVVEEGSHGRPRYNYRRPPRRYS